MAFICSWYAAPAAIHGAVLVGRPSLQFLNARLIVRCLLKRMNGDLQVQAIMQMKKRRSLALHTHSLPLLPVPPSRLPPVSNVGLKDARKENDASRLKLLGGAHPDFMQCSIGLEKVRTTSNPTCNLLATLILLGVLSLPAWSSLHN